MTRMTGGAHLPATMAVLCGLGGVAGFAKSKSTPSLAAGLALSAAFGASAYMITSTDQVASGYLCGTVASGVMTAAMASRFVKTRSVFPAGVLALIGGLSLAYHGSKYIQWSS
eukprot:TRINITY_DN3696_c0_g2_i1.p1 TRINITY_DN3696_c0_g2~~TRINITY_DN3696_c0_g2_i1.p1  ORF type:complete len:113 (+),score=43.91 TRINITY_DN3696_c0_g2_i1:57-395(+)